MVVTGTVESITLEYSTNGGKSWDNFDPDGNTTITLPNIGDRACFRAGAGGNIRISTAVASYRTFVFTGMVAVGGNIMSLLSRTVITEFPSRAVAARYTFNALFRGQTALVSASALLLPASILVFYCYYQLFYNCSNLTSIPELPALTLANNCYESLFFGCSSLTSPPVLSSTSLAYGCYARMFYNCTSLTTAPELPATALTGGWNYYMMFYRCRALTAAPSLSCTNLTARCYYGMFSGCINLASAPELPATTLTDYCYYQMFNGCTSLTDAPYLPAETLVNSCYYQMFSGCSRLNHIKTEQTSFTGCGNWVNGVASSGTFECPTSLGTDTTIQRGASACPSNWMVKNSYWGFCVEARTADASVSMIRQGDPPAVTLEYSTDGGSTWNTFDDNGGTTVTMASIGDTVCLRAGASGNSRFAAGGRWDYHTFSFSGRVALSGNIMSLLSQTKITEFPTITLGYIFAKLFENQLIADAGNLILPATVLAPSCYSGMFTYGSLGMAPALPATTLADYCYASMFAYCNLSDAPNLPATTLVSNCYNMMFYSSRILSITTAQTSFLGCDYWLDLVSATGTFYCPAALGTNATIQRGESACPLDWTVVNI